MSSDDQPSAKQSKLACPINDLADDDLLRIFKLLPPHERLIVSEVCKRWNEISKSPWRDVITLDVSSDPCDNIGSYIKKCPNLRSVFARGASFEGESLQVLSRVDLSSIKLYGCSRQHQFIQGESFVRVDFIGKPIIQGEIFDFLSAMFSAHLPQAFWEELVLHQFDAPFSCSKDGFVAGALPLALKRLQLSGVKVVQQGRDGFTPRAPPFLRDLARLQNLSCLILASAPDHCLIGEAVERSVHRTLRSLPNLRELFLGGDVDSEVVLPGLADVVLSLPRLEVLFLNNALYADVYLPRLVTEHPTLRVLVVAGRCMPSDEDDDEEEEEERVIPPRRLNANGFGSQPLPLLHVFLGKQASEKLLFTESSSGAAKFYPITDPLPEFIEKAEIAPIFEGVWIAEQIKEAAKFGAALCEYEGAALSVRFASAEDDE